MTAPVAACASRHAPPLGGYRFPSRAGFRATAEQTTAMDEHEQSRASPSRRLLTMAKQS